MATEAWRYNNMMARLRVARDKYYGGYGVGGDVGNGTHMTVAQMNNAASWCLNVTNRSPLRHSYNTVSSGERVVVWKLDDNHNKINSVSVCYGNCHSNCYCDSHSCADGK